MYFRVENDDHHISPRREHTAPPRAGRQGHRVQDPHHHEERQGTRLKRKKGRLIER